MSNKPIKWLPSPPKNPIADGGRINVPLSRDAIEDSLSYLEVCGAYDTARFGVTVKYLMEHVEIGRDLWERKKGELSDSPLNLTLTIHGVPVKLVDVDAWDIVMYRETERFS